MQEPWETVPAGESGGFPITGPSVELDDPDGNPNMLVLENTDDPANEGVVIRLRAFGGVAGELDGALGGGFIGLNAGADHKAIWFRPNGNGVGEDQVIVEGRNDRAELVFGAAQDTALWRQSADHLATPDRFQVGNDIEARGSVDGTLLFHADGGAGGTGEVYTARGVRILEGADPAAPAVNEGRLYLRDSGGGKTQLCVRFNTGAVQVIATEP